MKHSSSRFTRKPNPRKIRLTPRDLQILKKVFQFRLLDSTHITRLIEGSAQGILRRLQLLYHHGYLDRPQAQIRYYQTGINRPLIYAVYSKGVRALKKAKLIDSKIRVPKKHLRSWGMEHRVGISDFFVRLISEKPTHLSVELENEIFKSGRESNENKEIKWKYNIRHKGRLIPSTTIPDGSFVIQEKGGGDAILYFLEYDRGTMPIKRKTLDQSSIHRKLLAYHASWKSQIPQKKFGCARIRVLFVTSGQDRMTAMLNLAKSMNNGRGSGLFAFTSINELKTQKSIWEAPLRFTDDEIESTLSNP